MKTCHLSKIQEIFNDLKLKSDNWCIAIQLLSYWSHGIRSALLSIVLILLKMYAPTCGHSYKSTCLCGVIINERYPYHLLPYILLLNVTSLLFNAETMVGAYDIFCTTVFPNCNIVRLFNSHSLMGWVTFSILCMQCTINSGANSLKAVLLLFVLENVMWCDPRHWKYFISVLEKKEERYILDRVRVSDNSTWWI